MWNPETEPGFATGPDVGDVVIPTGPRRAGNHHGPGWLIGVTPNAAGSSPEIDVTDVGRIIGDLVMSAPLIHPPGLGATRSSGVTTVAR